MTADMENPEAIEAASLLAEERGQPLRPWSRVGVRKFAVVGGVIAVALCGSALLASSSKPTSAKLGAITRLDDAEEVDADDAASSDSDDLDAAITGGSRDADDHEVEAEDPYARCAWGRENCTAKQCCNNPGHQCFYQNDNTGYGQCRPSCTPDVPDPTHWDSELWECTELGDRSEGEASCSEPGEDCRNTKCCSQPNTQCYEKNDGWATCKPSCAAGAPDLGDMDSHPWTCRTLGPRALVRAPWVEHVCAGDGDDCRSSKCCKAPGAQCYEQNDDWGACKYDCTPGKDEARFWEPEWSCGEVGLRTPGDGPGSSGVVASWVEDECAWDENDCSHSKCCVGMNKQCYEKDEYYATCMESCTPGPNPWDGNASWSCRELGTRSNGLAVKGDPSLYCWSLFQTTTYENDVMKFQRNAGYGIFQCDLYSLLSTDEAQDFGKDTEGNSIRTLQVENAEITTSVDGTAGNAQLFINVWNVVVQTGIWNNAAWTVKVDPDAVVIADRLRQHLAPYELQKVYVVNCNKFPSSANFPMMYGSLEIYSWKAIQTYSNHMSSCMDDMGSMLPLWGEDYFMTHCLDHIGVGRISDFASVGDAVCMGANCGDQWVAAFHPFKDVEGWKECWDTAHR